MERELRASANGIAPEQTVAVIPSGIVDDPRCVCNLDRLGAEIVQAVKPIHRQLKLSGSRLKQVVVGGPPCFASVVDEQTPDAVRVSAHQRCFERFLDDTGDVGDGFSIPSVIDGQPPMGAVLEDLGRLSPEAASEFNLSAGEDRARIGTTAIRHLSPDRFARGRKKAECKRLEELTNEWFDQLPIADHTVVLSDGETDCQHLIAHANGESDWVKYPDGCGGTVSVETVSSGSGGCLSWLQAAIFDPRYQKPIEYSRLSSSERKQVHQWLTESARESLGFPQESVRSGDTSTEPVTDTQSSAAHRKTA